MDKRRLLISALPFLLPAAAWSQDNHDQRPEGRPAERPSAAARPAAPVARPAGPVARPGGGPGFQGGGRPGAGAPVGVAPQRPGGGRPENNGNPGAGSRPGYGGRPESGRPDYNGTPGAGYRPGYGRPEQGRPGYGGRPSYYRPGQGRPQNFRPIRGRPYNYPRGYSYRRWSPGLILPSLFLSGSYLFNDWYSMGLEPPPPGCAWVRYGPDLLLVQQYSGRIVDVIYGAFY